MPVSWPAEMRHDFLGRMQSMLTEMWQSIKPPKVCRPPVPAPLPCGCAHSYSMAGMASREAQAIHGCLLVSGGCKLSDAGCGSNFKTTLSLKY